MQVITHRLFLFFIFQNDFTWAGGAPKKKKKRKKRTQQTSRIRSEILKFYRLKFQR